MRTILLTWNPGTNDQQIWDPVSWDQQMVEDHGPGRASIAQWSVARRRNHIEPGDQGFLLRQGGFGRGIVARCSIQSTPFPSAHWRDASEQTNYVRVAWLECLPLDDRLTTEDLKLGIPGFPWHQVWGSGREVPSPYAEALEQLWVSHCQMLAEMDTPAGAGIGDRETNALVESVAMRTVRAQLTSDGHAVVDVSAEKCGWDITATKGSRTRHIEVKGIAGAVPSFFLTANERAAAGSDLSWELWTVTEALSLSPVMSRFTGSQVAAHSKAVTFKVDLRTEQRRTL